MEREIFSLGGSAHYMMIKQQVSSGNHETKTRILDEAEKKSPLLEEIWIKLPEIVLISSSSSSSWIGWKALPAPSPLAPLQTHRCALICSKVEA